MNTSDAISLISKTRERINRHIISEMEKHGIVGIATSHGDIINALFKVPFLTMADVAAQIGKDKSTVTVLVEKLVKQGYVTKRRDSQDTRVTLVQLTEKGYGLKPAFDAVSDSLMETFYKGINEEDREILIMLLKKINANFLD